MTNPISFRSYNNNNYVYDMITNTIYFRPEKNKIKVLDSEMNIKNNYYHNIIDNYKKYKKIILLILLKKI